MLLTIRTTYQPATDLGFLLHKHPEHVHTREFPFSNLNREGVPGPFGGPWSPSTIVLTPTRANSKSS